MAQEAAFQLAWRVILEVLNRRLAHGSECEHFRGTMILSAPALEFIAKQDDEDFQDDLCDAFATEPRAKVRREHDTHSHAPIPFSLVIAHYRPEALPEPCMQRLEMLVLRVPQKLPDLGCATFVEGNCWVKQPSGRTPLFWNTDDCKVFKRRDQLGSLGVL